MKKYLIIIFLLISQISFSQENHFEKEIKKEMITLKQRGWQSLTTGLLVHGMTNIISFYEGGTLNDPRRLENFIIGNTVGLGLDIISFTYFIKYKKLKKRYNSVPKLL